MRWLWWAGAALLAGEVAYRRIVADKNRLYLGMLERVATRLEQGGIDYWLDWGTLLGAVRDGGLMPHDTDVDLSVAREEVPRLRALMDGQPFGDALRVELRDTDVAVRVPPHPTLDTVRDMALLHVEFVDERDDAVWRPYRGDGVSVRLLRPMGRVRLAGRWYAAPARPAAYLDALYGYSGRACVFLGNDRYRPCRTPGEHAMYWWNRILFYRVYFLWKGAPLPRRWKKAVEGVTEVLYPMLMGAPKT